MGLQNSKIGRFDRHSIFVSKSDRPMQLKRVKYFSLNFVCSRNGNTTTPAPSISTGSKLPTNSTRSTEQLPGVRNNFFQVSRNYHHFSGRQRQNRFHTKLRKKMIYTSIPRKNQHHNLHLIYASKFNLLMGYNYLRRL